MFRGYTPPHSWEQDVFFLYDMKCMAPDVVVTLHQNKMCTYNLIGRLINTQTTRTSIETNCQIASINDSTIAVTVSRFNLIQIVRFITPTVITDLTAPARTRMTG